MENLDAWPSVIAGLPLACCMLVILLIVGFVLAARWDSRKH